jgi:hypothetical protein
LTRSDPQGKKIAMNEEEYGSGVVQEPPVPAEEAAVHYFSKPEQILDADDQQWGEVPVPEWAPRNDPHPERWVLKLKGLNGADRDRFEASINQTRGGKQKQNYDNFRARLIVMCAVDPDGNRIFSRADITRLGAKSAKALDRVFTKCNELNGFSEDDVSEMTEGFDSAPNGGSTSD